MQVEDWMEKSFAKIQPKTSVGEVKKILKGSDLSCGIVCDGESFTGIVKADEILGADDELPVSDYVREVPYKLDPQDTLDEASVYFLESDLELLPVVSGARTVGVLSLFQILDAFTQMAGFGEGGVRLEIELSDTPGALKRVFDVLYVHSMNVLSVLLFPAKDVGRKVALIRVSGKGVRELAKILDANEITYKSIIKEDKI